MKPGTSMNPMGRPMPTGVWFAAFQVGAGLRTVAIIACTPVVNHPGCRVAAAMMLGIHYQGVPFNTFLLWGAGEGMESTG